MGTYDTVHTGTRCGQTKALGQGMRDLTPGSQALLRVRLTDDSWSGTHTPDFALMMHGGGFLLARGGVLLSWGEDPEDLPAFTARGAATGQRRNDPGDLEAHLARSRAQLERVGLVIPRSRMTKAEVREDLRDLERSRCDFLALSYQCMHCDRVLREAGAVPARRV
jgi:hypothetical protein